MKILEGGNVFKTANGQSATQRIAQTDVKPTLAWLEHMLPDLDLQNNTLGSKCANSACNNNLYHPIQRPNC